MLNLIVSFTVKPLPTSQISELIPDFVPSRACVKDEAKAKNVLEQREKWMDSVYDNIYTSRISSFAIVTQHDRSGNVQRDSVVAEDIDGDAELCQKFGQFLDVMNREYYPHIRWFGVDPKGFTKRMFLAMASQGLLVNQEYNSSGELAVRLLYGADQLNSLLSPSGVVSDGNPDGKISRIAGDDRTFYDTLVDGTGTKDVLADVVNTESIFARFGILQSLPVPTMAVSA